MFSRFDEERAKALADEGKARGRLEKAEATLRVVQLSVMEAGIDELPASSQHAFAELSRCEDALKQCLPQSKSLFSSFGFSSSSSSKLESELSDEQRLYVEVMQSQVALLRSLLLFRRGNIVKGAFALRGAWKSFKSAEGRFEKEFARVDDVSRRSQNLVNLRSELFFGAGFFYFFLSLVPPKFMWVVEAIGFESDRERGLRYFNMCNEEAGVRAPMALLMLLWVRIFFFEDEPASDALLAEAARRYPDGGLFHYLAGYHYRKHGNNARAIEHFERVRQLFDALPQMRLNATYELGWCYHRLCDWRNAVAHIRDFLDTSQIESFRCFAGYQLAYAYDMLATESGDGDERERYAQAARGVAAKVEGWQRKHFSFDVYAVRKANEFLEAGALLPVQRDLLVLANLHKSRPIQRERIDALVAKAHAALGANGELSAHSLRADFLIELLYLSGLIDVTQRRLASARQLFERAIELADQLEREHWIVPHSLTELAAIEPSVRRAKQLLGQAKVYVAKGVDFDKPLSRKISRLQDENKALRKQRISIRQFPDESQETSGQGQVERQVESQVGTSAVESSDQVVESSGQVDESSCQVESQDTSADALANDEPNVDLQDDESSASSSSSDEDLGDDAFFTASSGNGDDNDNGEDDGSQYQVDQQREQEHNVVDDEQNEDEHSDSDSDEEESSDDDDAVEIAASTSSLESARSIERKPSLAEINYAEAGEASKEVQERREMDSSIMELEGHMRAKVGGVSIKKRRWHLRTYDACMVGTEVTKWLMRNVRLSEVDAVRLGQRMIDSKVMSHVVDRDKPFVNDKLFYRFHQDRASSKSSWMLNTRRKLWVLPPRPAAFVLQDLYDAIFELYHRFLDAAGEGGDHAVVNDETLQRMSQSDAWNCFLYRCAELQSVDLTTLSSLDDVKCFFMNLYNIIVVHGHVVLGRPDSTIARGRFFMNAGYVVNGIEFTLDQIEHGILRCNGTTPGFYKYVTRGGDTLRSGDPRLRFLVPLDPRIHFALNCGAYSCPSLALYTAATLNEALDLAAEEFVQNDLEVSVVRSTVTLSKIFNWYKADFPSPTRQLLGYLLQYTSGTLRARLQHLLATPSSQKIRVECHPYLWSQSPSLSSSLRSSSSSSLISIPSSSNSIGSDQYEDQD
jgi:tetratricopeptide (TPR) repeat protein